MNRKSIIRAWKDPEYRASLSEAERAALPENPAGEALTDEDLEAVQGSAVAATWTIIPLTTEAISCWPGCDSSVWKGSCAFASVGCCGAEFQVE